MRVVFVVAAATLMVAVARADQMRDAPAGAMGRDEPYTPPPPPAYTPAPPPPTTSPQSHFIPRPSEVFHAIGNYMHQHHQDHAAAHHQTHAQHHVDAHGATLPTTPAPAPAPGQPGYDPNYSSTTPKPPAGPQPPHVRPHLASHFQGTQGGGGGSGIGGFLSNHHASHHADNKVVATRTVFVEVTKRVTRHPVCMTVYGQRPPCLPYHEYRQSPYKKPGNHGYRMYEEEDTDTVDQATRMMYDEDEMDVDLPEGYYIAPTAVAHMGPASVDPHTGFRSKRYIERRRPSQSPVAANPMAEPAKSDDGAATPPLEDAPVSAPLERQGPFGGVIGGGFSQLASGMSSMMGGGPIGQPTKSRETVYEIKTLWVTKVERFTDYRVTATLVAENCVPTDAKIPFCHTGHQGPSYESSDAYTPAPAPYTPAPYANVPYTTDKPHIITTPKPPKPHGFGPPPPPPHGHLGGLLHRPTTTTTTPKPYYKPPAAPAYAPPPAYAPAPAPAYAPAPAPAYAPAAAPQYAPPAAEYPPNTPPPSYPPPASEYSPAPAPAPAPANYAPPAYAPPPPPATAEPAYDYPSGGPDSTHWKDSEPMNQNMNQAVNQANSDATSNDESDKMN